MRWCLALARRHPDQDEITLLVHHQYVKHHDRRQAQDHGPDAERPENILGAETLFLREWIIPVIHDAPPRFLVVSGD
jgi:hypothetical protein